jgi:hypothetical protein
VLQGKVTCIDGSARQDETAANEATVQRRHIVQFSIAASALTNAASMFRIASGDASFETTRLVR